MKAQTILVVDDDPKIRAVLRNVLEDDGFLVVEAKDAAEAFDRFENQRVSLITLDVHLGKDNGVALAREIRRISQVPIIMVTGKNDTIDCVVGLEVGADDYITKPFHIREVTARIRSVLRRSESNAAPAFSDPFKAEASHRERSPKYCFDGIIVDPDSLEILDRDDKDIGLTSGDFKLLMAFLERPKRVLSRDQLMDLTGGTEWNALDRTIDNQVARLRKKIERDPSAPKLIKTVRGVGYTLSCDVKTLDQSALPSRRT